MNIPAGYALLAYCYFDAMAYPSSNLPAADKYGVYFYKKAFTGTALRLKAGSRTPVIINTPGDVKFGQKPREAQFSLMAQSALHLSDFFSNNDRDFFVTIDRVTGGTSPQPVLDGNVYAGWVSPFEAKEPYASTPYPMELSAVDGLGTLADYEFYQYPSGTPYAGSITLAEALITALAWTGFHMPVYSSFHLAEESFWGASSLGTPQHPGPHNDFFSNVKVSVTRWQNDDGTWKKCKQVIDDIIGPNARLCQVDGAWRILRLPELPGVSDFQGNYGYTRSWVVYDTGLSGQTVVGFVQEDPRRTVYKKNDAIPLTGANLGKQRNEPRVKIIYTYGGTPDVLKNGGMLGIPDQIPDGWTRTHLVGPNAGPYSSGITETGNCILIAATDTLPSRARILGMKNGDPTRTFQNDYRNLYILQQSYYYDLRPDQQLKLVFSGSYINHINGGAAFEAVATLGFNLPGTTIFVPMPEQGVTGNAVGNSFSLQSDGSWGSKKKSSTVLYLHFMNVQADPPVGNVNDHGKTYRIAKATNGEQFSVSAQAVPLLPYPGVSIPTGSIFPTVVRIVLSLYPGPDFDTRGSKAGCYTDYYNIKVSQDESVIVDLDREEIYAEVAGLTPKDRKRTTELSMALGYQTTAHMVPARALRPGGLLKLDGKTPIGRVMTTSGHVDKLQNIEARERLEMVGLQRGLYDGSKLTDANPLSVLYFPELGGIYMIPISHKWNLRERIVEGRDVELPGLIDRLTDPVFSAQYLTKDGAVYDMKDAATAGPGAVVTPIGPSGSTSPVVLPAISPITPRFGTPGDSPVANVPGTFIRPNFLKNP